MSSTQAHVVLYRSSSYVQSVPSGTGRETDHEEQGIFLLGKHLDPQAAAEPNVHPLCTPNSLVREAGPVLLDVQAKAELDLPVALEDGVVRNDPVCASPLRPGLLYEEDL